jgi:excisionase family DNA binding protein
MTETGAPHSGQPTRTRVTAAAPVRRVTLTPIEAAAALGVSRDFFDEHVKPELRLIRRGRLVLVPVGELERWANASAERTLR